MVGRSGNASRSLVAAHRERPDLAGLGGAGDAVEALEHQIDVPGDQIVDRRRAAAIRHVLDLRPGHELEQLAADMAGRAVARRRVGELARIGLGLLDQFLHRFDVGLRRHREHQMPMHDQRDRLEILLDNIGQLGHHVAGDRHRADRSDRQRVAVRRRLCDVVHAKRERAAGLVLDDDGRAAERRAELGGQDARHSVGRAAGGLRHDQPDRPVGIFGACRDGNRQQRSKQTANDPSRPRQPIEFMSFPQSRHSCCGSRLAATARFDNRAHHPARFQRSRAASSSTARSAMPWSSVGAKAATVRGGSRSGK